MHNYRVTLNGTYKCSNAAAGSSTTTCSTDSNVYLPNNCNGNQYWNLTNTNNDRTTIGSISECECSSQCAIDPSCGAYLIDPESKICYHYEFFEDSADKAKSNCSSSSPDYLYYGRVKKS